VPLVALPASKIVYVTILLCNRVSKIIKC
jgi:hypothetical protein